MSKTNNDLPSAASVNTNVNGNDDKSQQKHMEPAEEITSATQDQNTRNRNKLELKQSEYDFAMEIRDLVENTAHIHNLTDFDYVCYAIAAENESFAQVLARIYTMQCFREKYRIQETSEEGSDLLFRFLITQQPRLLLDMEYIDEKQSFFAVLDLAMFCPARIKTHDDFRVYLGGSYYLWHCQFPEFRSLRNGARTLCECMDSSVDNFDYKVNRRSLHELVKCYPRVDEALYTIHCSLVPGMIYDVMKEFLPDKVKNSLHLGFTLPALEDQRLDGLYNSSTPEAAQERLLAKMSQFLLDRYHNRAIFSLENASIVPDDAIFDPRPTTDC